MSHSFVEPCAILVQYCAIFCERSVSAKLAENTHTMARSPTQSFWDAAAPLIAVTENHSFLVSMVDGSLELEKFRYYVIQGASYAGELIAAACAAELSRASLPVSTPYRTDASTAIDALYLTDFSDCLHRLGDRIKTERQDDRVAKRLHQFAEGAEEAEKDLHRSFFKQ